MPYQTPTELLHNLRDNHNSGLYYIRAKSEHVIRGLSISLYTEYLNRDDSPDPLVIYIGKATDLHSRLQQELYHTGPGTFFRSLGAAMGKKPLLANTEAGVRNYRFGEPEKSEIISFIENNLEIAVEFTNVDDEIIKITTYKPIFNMRHNPQPVSFIQNARNRCKKIAAGQITIN